MGIWDAPVEQTKPLLASVEGRRLRIWFQIARVQWNDASAMVSDGAAGAGYGGGDRLMTIPPGMTWRESLAEAERLTAHESILKRLESIPLRAFTATSQMLYSIHPDLEKPANPSLPSCLQDLATVIIRDITDAIDAATEGGWYAGVDDGIEPVPDSHVELVIWGMQRELNRERRNANGINQEPKLPAFVLASMTWAIQRALVERRRLRYAQFGVGRAEWQSGKWSLSAVPDDPEWTPTLVQS